MSPNISFETEQVPAEIELENQTFSLLFETARHLEGENFLFVLSVILSKLREQNFAELEDSFKFEVRDFFVEQNLKFENFLHDVVSLSDDLDLKMDNTLFPLSVFLLVKSYVVFQNISVKESINLYKYLSENKNKWQGINQRFDTVLENKFFQFKEKLENRSENSSKLTKFNDYGRNLGYIE